jgi:secreted trypsin-like serine protease
VGSRGNFCTGSLIAPHVVLTVAHCVQPGADYKIVAYGADGKPQLQNVRKVAIHPNFNMQAMASHRATADVALLKLEKPLPDIVVPAALGAKRRVKPGEALTIAGFGVIQAGTGHGLGLPREAKLTVTGHPSSLQIRLVDPITRNQRSGLGACTGDSGAPAYDGDGPQKSGQVIGVVSWTTAPNDEEGCGGFTGLTPLLRYRDWIVETAKKLGSPIAP